MRFAAWAGDGRSGLALRIAAFATLLFGGLVVVFNAGHTLREPLLTWAFPANALLFHVGLGIAVWARLGHPDKRGPHANVAILANLVPVALFWFFVYALVQALRNFT